MNEETPRELSKKEKAMERFSRTAMQVLENKPTIPKVTVLRADLIINKEKLLDNSSEPSSAYMAISARVLQTAIELGIDSEKLDELADLAIHEFEQGTKLADVIKIIDAEISVTKKLEEPEIGITNDDLNILYPQAELETRFQDAEIPYIRELVEEASKEEKRERLVTATPGQKAIATQGITEVLGTPMREERESALDDAWLSIKNELKIAEPRKLTSETLEGVLASGIDAEVKKDGSVELHFAEILRDILDENDAHLASILNMASTDLIYAPKGSLQEELILEKYKKALEAVRVALSTKFDNPEVLLDEIDRRVQLALITNKQEEGEQELEEIKDKSFWEELKGSARWFGMGTLYRSFIGQAVELANRIKFRHLIKKGGRGLVYASVLATLGGAVGFNNESSNVKSGKKVAHAETTKVSGKEEPMQASEETVSREIIGQGDSAWRAASRLAKQHGMDERTFLRTWHNPESQVELKGGKCIHISAGNFTNMGDVVYYVASVENKPGYFKVEAHRTWAME